jgi:hypothetical protein
MLQTRGSPPRSNLKANRTKFTDKAHRRASQGNSFLALLRGPLPPPKMYASGAARIPKLLRDSYTPGMEASQSTRCYIFGGLVLVGIDKGAVGLSIIQAAYNEAINSTWRYNAPCLVIHHKLSTNRSTNSRSFLSNSINSCLLTSASPPCQRMASSTLRARPS